MLDRDRGALPLYVQVKKILMKRIQSGVYCEGDIIPAELEFQKEFDVSRITVRQAINELVSEGVLSRKRGRGTVVLPKQISEKLGRIKSFTQEMEEMGYTPKTYAAKIHLIPAGERIARKLEVDEKEAVYCVERIRGTDEHIIVLFINYVKRELKLPLEDEMYFDSLYRVIEENNPNRISKASEQFSALTANSEIAKKLQIQKGDPILLRERVSYDESGTIIEFSICYYIAERYQYTIDLER